MASRELILREWLAANRRARESEKALAIACLMALESGGGWPPLEQRMRVKRHRQLADDLFNVAMEQIDERRAELVKVAFSREEPPEALP